MNWQSIPNRAALIVFAAICLAGHVGRAAYYAVGRRESDAFELLFYFGFAGALGHWIIVDSRRIGLRRNPDGGFVYWGWPIALPWHAFKTRRSQGFKTLGGFLAIFFGAYLVSLVVFFSLKFVRGHPL
jgi:hypothetical protein